MSNLDVLLTKLVSAFLLPPLDILVLLFGGVVLLKRHPRLGRAIILGACVVLYAASTPVIVSAVRRQFEKISPLSPTSPLPPADAIVVLSGGLYRNAPEYGGDTISGRVLERLRYTARLYRLTGKPVLVSGGSWRTGVRPEAHAIKESLEQDFHVPVQWLEDQSRNTGENAKLSAAILHREGIRKIYLVTHALHMPRAREAFERAGFQVTPAPTIFATQERLSVLHFLPHSSTLETSTILLHEWIGRVWYGLDW
ncbi:MAG: YdcF family protein [Deltaproteobacteria bacterium]|nr:YdcF family protein [Deltaproteobacteria bacterium]